MDRFRAQLAVLAAAWIGFASSHAAAATCEDVDPKRPQELVDFCAAAKVVAGYITDYTAKNSGKDLPPEVLERLGAIETAYFKFGKDSNPKSLLLDVVPRLLAIVAAAEAPTLNDDKVRTALRGLDDQIDTKLYQVDKPEATRALAAAQKIASESVAPNLFADTTIAAATKALIVSFIKVLPVDETFVGGVKSDATALATKVALGAPQLIKGALPSAPTAVGELRALRKEIDKVTGALQPRIHVYYAYFGDVKEVNGNRMCDATSAMRQLCEGNLSCVLPDNFATQLCGYNPAPFIEDRDRGASISYDCQIGDEDLWSRNIKAPPSKLMSDRVPKPVVLQSVKMGIACGRAP
ncbi:hypothetical protein HB777_18350 [Mesorhizobium loti]|nr:hypothetical protein HB777_18350 [Mesorhizobium loti]